MLQIKILIFLLIILHYCCSKDMYVNAQRKSTSDPDSCLRVSHFRYIDDFVRQFGPLYQHLKTSLVIFKVTILKHLCTAY